MITLMKKRTLEMRFSRWSKLMSLISSRWEQKGNLRNGEWGQTELVLNIIDKDL